MSKIIGYILGLITKYALMRLSYYALATVYFLSVVSMITAFFIGLDYFINLIRLTLSTMGNYSGGGSLVSKLYAMLNCIGFTSALNNTAPFLASSIVFLLARVLIIQVNKVFRVSFSMINKIMQNGLK